MSEAYRDLMKARQRFEAVSEKRRPELRVHLQDALKAKLAAEVASGLVKHPERRPS